MPPYPSGQSTLDSLGCVTRYDAMAERRLVILKRLGETPTLGKCERCDLKFFAPHELTYSPAEAGESLWQQFNRHVCKHEGRALLQIVRKG